jgi:hypothetical protein
MNNSIFIAENIDLFNADIPLTKTAGNDIVIPSSSESDFLDKVSEETTPNYTIWIIVSVAVILVIVIIAVLFKNSDRMKYSEISQIEDISQGDFETDEAQKEIEPVQEKNKTVKKSSYTTPSSISAAIRLFLEKTKNR